MKKVLYILGKLSDTDIEWLAEMGEKEQLVAGSELITQGQESENLYFILGGEFKVMIAGQAVATLGIGEILGELSFLDSRPPAATVVATKASRVFAVPKEDLNERLEDDEGFAARFYLALGVFLATRLRGTMSQFGYSSDKPLDEDQEYADEIEAGLLDDVSLAGARFDNFLRRLEDA
ncbi:MAG: cyclic nucleotide-binding domain-containing protein [Planctomycetota bacterium]|nr:cyclic nucleotide-binding domain-containing protein [Planctomycetota bacterium]